MYGSRITNAANALRILLTAMNPNHRFNVYGFGNTFYRFFDSSVDYTEQTFNQAKCLINTKVKANLGGTEMNAVLQHIYQQPVAEGYKRRVILLTDGQVYHMESLFKIVESHQSTRVYTIGIGNSVCHELLEGLAKRTGGHCEVVMEDDMIETKTLFQLRYALSKEAEVTIGDINVTVYPGLGFSKTFVREKPIDGEAVSVENAGDVLIVPLVNVQEDGEYPLRLLHMKNAMQNLIGDDLVKMSLDYGILSKETAFVGVMTGKKYQVEKGSNASCSFMFTSDTNDSGVLSGDTQLRRRGRIAQSRGATILFDSIPTKKRKKKGFSCYVKR